MKASERVRKVAGVLRSRSDSLYTMASTIEALEHEAIAITKLSNEIFHKGMHVAAGVLTEVDFITPVCRERPVHLYPDRDAVALTKIQAILADVAQNRRAEIATLNTKADIE